MQAYLAWNEKQRQKLLQRSAKKKENIVDGALDQRKVGGKEMRIETEGRGERHIQINDFWFQRTDDSRQEGTMRVKIKQLVEPGEDEGQKIRS